MSNKTVRVFYLGAIYGLLLTVLGYQVGWIPAVLVQAGVSGWLIWKREAQP